MHEWQNPRTSAVYRARGILAQLTDRNLKLPDTVAQAVERLDRIEATVPKQPAPDAVRRAIFDGETADHINALLLADLAHSKLAVEHQQARVDAALAILAEIRAAHSDLFPLLKSRALRLIEHLAAVNKLPTSNVMELVRAGDHQGAQLVAEVDTVAAELDVLYGMRDGYLIPGSYTAMRMGPVDASRWRDPEQHGRGETLVERFLDGLRRGNELWFPNLDEALEAARPVYEQMQAKAERDVQIRRAQNASAAAFA